MKHLKGFNCGVRAELIFIFVVCIIAFSLFNAFDVTEKLSSWLALQETFELDELLPTSVVALILIGQFALRRWQETKHQCEELLKAEREIHHLAYHDHLTGLPNRSLVMDRIQQAMRQADRSQKPISLVFLDLDHFKDVNDELGHLVGDELLKNVVQRIQPHVRESDTFGRLGGDEFALILLDVADIHAVHSLITRIHEQFQAPFAINNHRIRCTTSMGIASYPEDGQSLSTLLSAADRAMYRAKADGKNSFRFYSALIDRAPEDRIDQEGP